MKLVKPKFEIIEQPSGLEGIYKMIEIAGRTCYRSEDKITEDSAKGFVQRMIRAGHLSVLEHGTVCLHPHITVKESHDDNIRNGWIDWAPKFAKKYCNNPYSKILLMDNDIYVTTNYRVLVENNWLDDLKYLCEPIKYRHARRVTVKFVCDRGILAEFTRHRVFSFSAESTRYCNYSRDKFGNELTFIIPCWLENIEEGHYGALGDNTELGYNIVKDQKTDISLSPYEYCFFDCLECAEIQYMNLLKKWDDKIPDRRYKTQFKGNPWTPQQARAILPNALKTELVMTGFISDWKHFFGLRTDEAAHPQARELAIPLKKEFIKRGYIKD